MTNIPLEDYQNAKNHPQIFWPADNQDKDGFKLENVGPSFQLHLSEDVLLMTVSL